ncbi:hypothetical protein D3C81_2236760 [compost metagenome]
MPPNLIEKERDLVACVASRCRNMRQVQPRIEVGLGLFEVLLQIIGKRPDLTG